jgi:hypothetical protein
LTVPSRWLPLLADDLTSWESKADPFCWEYASTVVYVQSL